MSKHKKHKNKHGLQPEMPLGEARGQKADHLQPVGVDGDGHGPVQPPASDAYLSHVMPAQQQFAKDFLHGEAEGLMQRLAPGAAASDVEGWVEDDSTVDRLARWHREAPHG